MKLSKELKTGLLALVAILLLIFGYSFLKGENLLKSDRTFYAVYENVEGLSTSSKVTINGLEVGNVLAIDFYGTRGKLLVTFRVDSDFSFSNNSLAKIYGGDLIGGKSMAIIPEYARGQQAKTGDTLPSAIDEGIFELVNDRLTPLQNKVESAITNADSVLVAVSDVLNKDSRENLRIAIADFTQTASSLKTTASSLSRIVNQNEAKLSNTLANIDHMSTNFSHLSDTLAQLDITSMVNNMERVIADFQSISNKIEKGDGTLGKFINDDRVYENLSRATEQMEELMQDIKLNPKRYVHFSVFGKKAGQYEEPLDSLR